MHDSANRGVTLLALDNVCCTVGYFAKANQTQWSMLKKWEVCAHWENNSGLLDTDILRHRSIYLLNQVTRPGVTN